MAAIARGLRRPCSTAITTRGFSSGAIRDQVIANRKKAQRTCGEVRTLVALVGKRCEGTNGVEYLHADAPRCQDTVLRDEFPDFRDVLGRARMEIEARLEVHLGDRGLSSSSSRSRKLSKKASPSMGFTRPLLMSS